MKTAFVFFCIALKIINSADLELTYKKDAPIIITAIPLAFYVQNEFLKLKPVSDIDNPSENKPLWGEWSQKQYSEKAQLGGNILLAGSFVLTILQSANNSWGQNNKSIFLTETIIFLEALSFSSMLNLWVRSMPMRPRPLVYNDRAPLQRRTKRDASSSFYSGHSSASFLIASYTTFLYNLHFPESRKKGAIAMGSYSLATLIALSRLYGGNHYATDLVVGAAVGSLFGYVFPIIHLHSEKNNPVSFNLKPNGASLNYIF